MISSGPGRQPYTPFPPILPVAILNSRPKGIHIIDSPQLRHFLVPNPPEETETFDEKLVSEPVVANFSIRHFLQDLNRPPIQEEARPLPPDTAAHPIEEQPLVDSATELGRFNKPKKHVSRRHPHKPKARK